MKTIIVTNPDNRLIAAMSNAKEVWVRTCHSDTCTCASHDSGYWEWTGEVPETLTVEEVGGSVHSHGRTIINSDEIGALEFEAHQLAHTLEMWGIPSCQAAERTSAEVSKKLRIATKALDYLKAGMALEKAMDQASLDEAEDAKALRRARRQTWVSAQMKGGLTEQEANQTYGIGPWCQELNWPAIKRTIETLTPFQWDDLCHAPQASSRREALRLTSGIFPESSHPRLTAWAAYAVKIFG